MDTHYVYVDRHTDSGVCMCVCVCVQDVFETVHIASGDLVWLRPFLCLLWDGLLNTWKTMQ